MGLMNRLVFTGRGGGRAVHRLRNGHNQRVLRRVWTGSGGHTNGVRGNGPVIEPGCSGTYAKRGVEIPIPGQRAGASASRVECLAHRDGTRTADWPHDVLTLMMGNIFVAHLYRVRSGSTAPDWSHL